MRWPSRSSAIRASSRTGTSWRASPTATLAGLPPGAASNSPLRPAGTKSISASPATATTPGPPGPPLAAGASDLGSTGSPSLLPSLGCM